jgi:hypothetical protein
MLRYADIIEKASAVVVRDYIQLDEDSDHDGDENNDPEGFQMSSLKWPKGALQAMLHTPSPPTSAQHALQLYESALKSHPNHPQAHVWCAEAARLCADDLEAALCYLKTSIALKKSSDGYYVLAHILLMQGYTKEAHLAATTAYEIDSWRPKVQHALRLAQMALVDPTITTGAAKAPETQQQPQQQWCAQCDPLCPTRMATPPKTLFHCARCGNASYCSKACQTQAWNYHKIYCESPATIQAVLTGTTPAHLRVLDGWALPTLQDIADVFGASRDIRHPNYYFDPPTGFSVLDPQEYERRATTANASSAGYTQMQDALQDEAHNRTVTAFRNVKIRLHHESDEDDDNEEAGYDLDAYRAARTAFLHVKHSAWDAYCEELLKKQVYVFLTQDYVDALADYLKQRLVEYGGGEIVEIGAGNGRLAFFLQQRGIPIVATDDCSWKLSSDSHQEDDNSSQKNKKRDVEIYNLSCDQALKAHAPTIVLCAWMPMYNDFTAAFCATPSVQEYLLIGPAPVCGHAFDTWGFDDHHRGATAEPVYARNGFQKCKSMLVELEKLQLCKTDKPTEMFASQTVCFKRVERE